MKEVDKFVETAEQRETISRFLDFLGNKDIVLCKWNNDTLYNNEGDEIDMCLPIHTPNRTLIAKFCGIDEVKLEKERREILENLK